MGVNGIYGLSGSGLDVESMVKVGMMSKQSQLEKMQQTYTKNEWKKDAYLDVYSKIQEYNTSTLSTYKLSSNMNARTATSSNALIKATANASAPAMNHNITVESTATNAYLVGTEKLTSTKLSDLVDSGDLTFYIGDTTDVGVTPATYASATFTSSSTFLSTSTSKFHSILNDALEADKLENGTDNIITNSDSSNALSFNILDGTTANVANVNITYGDIATLLADKNSNFQDLVNLLNKKISEIDGDGERVAITASYDASTQSLTFTNNVASETATVSVGIVSGTGEAGKYILQSLYDNADSTTQDLFGLSDDDAYSLDFESEGGGTPATLDTTKAKQITISSADIASGATLYDLISKVNSAGTSIRATYDSAQNEFSFYNMKVGSANSITIQSVSEGATTLLTKMGLKSTQSGADLTNVSAMTFAENEVKYTAGTDASVLIDGKSYSNISANNVTVNGVTYNFGNVTEKTSAVVTVEQDVDKIVDNVKSFVESYNKLLGELDDMYRETPNSSYAPLTDAQKAEMTEEQIKKWEEKAKAGMLYHDSTLRKIIDQMRGAVTSRVEGLGDGYKYDTAYSIGISTKGLYGQIQLDEDKLRAALNDDPDSVYKVFATLENDENDTSRIDSAKSGIAQRLSQVVTDSVKSINNVAGTSKDNSDDSQLSTLLRNLQTKMSNFQSMMNAFEESLYKKYDAMESALAMLGSQLNYVTSMFA
ncbi:MAG: flagellar filament capping protein FliD [Selenomonadaceae bacterium]|nr:flagellar filament capping protein FliD [Selenomonadaceae bacterium]